MDVNQLKALFGMKVTDSAWKPFQEMYDNADSAQRSKGSDMVKPHCDKFLESDEYKSGDKTYGGYRTCCDLFGLCGGTSGWVIFLIIVLVLGVLAGGAAAFYFFYWKRKNGGKEEMIEENTESTDIENQKSVIEIPVGTY